MHTHLNRKTIFDAVREVIGRGFTQSEADRIEAAIDRALLPADTPAPEVRLGKLSEQFESGGRGAGTVSSGRGDPGGVSYGIYQLASRTGTAARFVESEGEPWRHEFAGNAPGSNAFSAAWRAIAKREPAAFAHAQHAYIERTHYRPAVEAVRARTGLNLDQRHQAVRDATWSVAVQHGGAAKILVRAIGKADAEHARDGAHYDRVLVERIYAERSRYVLRVAARSASGAARTLRSIVQNRYPTELAAARAMFGSGPANA